MIKTYQISYLITFESWSWLISWGISFVSCESTTCHRAITNHYAVVGALGIEVESNRWRVSFSEAKVVLLILLRQHHLGLVFSGLVKNDSLTKNGSLD